ncbi:MAG: hypothetical protein RPR91_10150 [Colwellia sp.]|jgi:hypothetical protein
MTQHRQQLQHIAHQALGVCEQLERGQADTPLSDMIYQQQSALASAPLTVILLGLTQDSLNQTLSWLYGDLFKGFNVSTEALSGYLEVSISQQGYGLGLVNSQQKKYEAQEDFKQALQIEMGLSKSSINNPFTMSLHNSRGVAGLKLLIPESMVALLDSPSLLNALISQSNLAMVAAPLKYTLSREDHDTVEALTSNMRGFWPLLTVDELAEDMALPEIGWWEQHKKAHEQLPPKLLTKHVNASLPALLTNANEPARLAYLNSFFANKLSQTVSAIFDRYQQEAGLLQQRQAKLQQKIRPVQNTMNDRSVQDKLRQTLDDEFLNTRKKIEVQLQKISLLQSPIMQAMEKQVQQLVFSDLNTEASHSVIKLSLQNTTVNDLKSTLLIQSEHALKDLYQQGSASLNEIIKHINQALAVQAITPLSPLEFKGHQPLFDMLKQRLEFNVNYRGEMPKRTTMTRLGESRKIIMGMSMAAMVLGGMAKAMWGIELRNALMGVAPVLLVGGFIYTFVQWPKEDAERLNKELDRIRDTLQSEVKRMVADIQRFIQQQIMELLEHNKRLVQKSLQEQLQYQQDQARKQEENQRQQQQKKFQQVDQSLRQWQTVERQLERLKSDAQTLERELVS